MNYAAERAEIESKIWKIANQVRGSVDPWDFKQYILGTLVYRFISENFEEYMSDEEIKYSQLKDEVITKEIIEDTIKTKGYFIYPSQLFVNVVANAANNPNLNIDLAKIFTSIENSALGYESEKNIKGLFAEFDTTSSRLGTTVMDKNNKLVKVLEGIAELNFGKFSENKIDLFGDAYEFLINNYAANSARSGGEYFTPQSVSKLIAMLAMHKQDKINKVYDPACGSGSLLLQAKKHFNSTLVEEGFYGQDINHTTYNLARMNMFLHNVNYNNFDIVIGDTLTNPAFRDNNNFDVIVSNPPYSVTWIGEKDPTLINDERFANAGVLAPASKADFAFVLHSLNYLSNKGRAAIVCFPGIFYRSGAEQKIRKYLIENNYIETIISLAPNLFYSTNISVTILILSKNKKDNMIQFIDASNIFKKQKKKNILTDKQVNKIIDLFDKKENIEYLSRSVSPEEIKEKDYDLSVSTYIQKEDLSEKIDIITLNSEVKSNRKELNDLRSEFDAIIQEIGE